MGHTHSSELRQNFGDPAVVDSQDSSNYWRYEDVSCKVDAISGIVMGCTWMSDGFDPQISTVAALLKYFKNSRFKKELVKAPRGSDYFSSETDYIDRENGVSFKTFNGDGVFLIGFSVPQESRKPATKPLRQRNDRKRFLQHRQCLPSSPVE